MSTPANQAPTDGETPDSGSVGSQKLAGTVDGRHIQLGLGANAGQFALLALVNLIVGGMVGLDSS